MPLAYDPEFAKAAAPILSQLRLDKRPAVHDIEARRAAIRTIASQHSEIPLPDDMQHLVHKVPAGDHQVEIHHFRKKDIPIQGRGAPAIIHIHGGGYISLSAKGSSATGITCTSLTGVQLLSIEYRLAPESPYLAALDDCWAALQWVHSHAAELSIDLHRLAVMGESSGGGIAAALTIIARDRSILPPLAKQILIYPMLDDRTVTNHTGNLAFWDEGDNITGWSAYLGPAYGTDIVPAQAAPARVETVEGLPPMYIDCPQLDIFVKENSEYVRRFLEANIPVEFHVYPGLPHGFEGLAPMCSAVQRAMANRLRAMMDF
ncbi:hypothetical protein N7463_000884 [Penicillium fimorum]|uniref:Alpha/beta hydrolase fold-3 domain-containing protein n=1 Tax=Penicillium fimorum TaxID=1882269 RepID=A0A9W9Y594_9EURO|nr:hypothetical protein N7463_000884 [Penicillium fimorum]